jgi:hypothetical protein
MELTDSVTSLFIDTAKSLKGSARRSYMARTVRALGPGGQRRAARALGWSRVTIRNGTHELASGGTGLEAFSARGRQRADGHLPHLLTDLTAIVDSPSQAAPPFRTTRLYTRLSAAAVRQPLMAHTGYTDEALPTVAPMTTQRTALGSYPKQVAKSQPQNKSQTPMPSLRT